MAYIVPNDIGYADPDRESAQPMGGELETLDMLHRKLPGAYTVYHGVHWSTDWKNVSRFGEIDFVVVNLAGAVLLIEQKNGTIEETESGLVKRYGSTRKNIAEQIRRSLEAVRKKFNHQNPNTTQLALDYLIYCPDHRLQRVNAVGLDASRVVHAGCNDGLAARIKAILPESDEGEARWVNRVHGFFQHSYELVPDIHAHIDGQQRAFTRLSGALVAMVQNIEMEPLRLRVYGTAGCGKSQIASDAYRCALSRGKRPLLLCFTRPLRDRLAAMLGGTTTAGGGMVQTWLGLCHVYLSERGHVLDYGKKLRASSFWHDVHERISVEKMPDHWRFDSVIVDEGQDFEQEWVEVLRLFLTPEASIMWLEDQDQNLFGRPPVRLDGFVGYHARHNFRTPGRIARFIRRALPPFKFEAMNPNPGLGVEVHPWTKPEQQVTLTGRIIGKLRSQGFAATDIVVLSCHGVSRASLFGEAVLGGQTVRRFTGDYAEDGNQIMTDGDLLLETVYRFKGQQAPAIILTDVDPDAERAEHWLRLLFCGCTRATVRLDILVRADNPATAPLLEAESEVS